MRKEAGKGGEVAVFLILFFFGPFLFSLSLFHNVLEREKNRTEPIKKRNKEQKKKGITDIPPATALNGASCSGKPPPLFLFFPFFFFFLIAGEKIIYKTHRGCTRKKQSRETTPPTHIQKPPGLFWVWGGGVGLPKQPRGKRLKNSVVFWPPPPGPPQQKTGLAISKTYVGSYVRTAYVLYRATQGGRSGKGVNR